MARINIEDQFWVDIADVAAKIGNRDEAIGMVIRFFRLAQEQFKKRKAMSEQDFKDQGFSEALIPIFANRTERGIEARGANKYFQWLHDNAKQHVEAGRKRAALAQRDVHGHFVASNIDDLKPSNTSGSPALSSESQSSSYSYVSKELNTFEQDVHWRAFWGEYPDKVNKGRALKAYAKCRARYAPEQIDQALNNLKAYKTKTKQQYPNPTTFLNNLSDFLETDYGKGPDDKKRREMLNV